LQKVLVVKNTTRKNIGDFVVYHKGLSFVVNATRWSKIQFVSRVCPVYNTHFDFLKEKNYQQQDGWKKKVTTLLEAVQIFVQHPAGAGQKLIHSGVM